MKEKKFETNKYIILNGRLKPNPNYDETTAVLERLKLSMENGGLPHVEPNYKQMLERQQANDVSSSFKNAFSGLTETIGKFETPEHKRQREKQDYEQKVKAFNMRCDIETIIEKENLYFNPVNGWSKRV